MKICYVSNNFEIHDYRFLQKMVENNYEVHAISLRKDRINDKFIIKGIQYYEFYKNRKIYQKRFHGLNLFWFLAAVRFLKIIIEEIKPDILHGGYASISGFICALTDFHPFLLMPWGSDILFEPKKNQVINILVSFSINHADMITCDAEEVKKEIMQNYHYDEEKIVVFPWGINLNIFNPDNNEMPTELLEWHDKIVAVCTRQHKKIYGIEYLINAIPLVIEQNNNVRFLFIGEGPLTKTYIKQLSRLNMGKYAKFAGKVKNEDLPFYLNNSDIYISSSLSDGSSLCLMEALACGLPVVVTNIAANYEWVRNNYNGIFCNKQDSDDISKSILKLASDENIHLEMGKHSLEVAENNANWDINFSKLEKIYNKLVKSLPHNKI